MARKGSSLPARSLTAAGSPIRIETITDVGELSKLKQEWWGSAWNSYDHVPPIHYGGQFIANSLSKLRLVAATHNPDTPDRPKEITEGPIANAVRKLGSKKGGQRAILRSIGLNLYVPGEVYLIGHGSGRGEEWEAVSNSELDFHTNSGRVLRRPHPGATPVYLPEDALTIRIWREHPQWSGLSDSPMRSLEEQCEAYTLLTRAERSISLSRIAGAGVLFVPQELIPPSYQSHADSANPQQSNPFWEELIRSMMLPIQDKGDPTNVVPLLLVGPAEYGDKIRHITLDRSFDNAIIEMKNDAVKQMAIALDLPAETLLGHSPSGSGDQTGGNNHFQASMLKREIFQNHVQPFAELVVDALTAGYLRPAMEREGLDPDEAFIWFDPSSLVLEPDLSETATQARDRLAISDSSYRRLIGLSEDDAPSDEEYARMVGLKVADARMAVNGEIPPDPKEMVAAQADAQAKVKEAGRPTETTAPDSGGRSAPKGPRAAPPQTPSQRRVVTASADQLSENLGYRLGQVDIALINRVQTIAEMGVHRTAEKIGARLRSKVSGTPVIRASISGMDNERAACYLGSMTASLGVSEYDLIVESLANVSKEFASAVLDAYDSSYDLIQVYLGSRAAREGNPVWRSFAASMSEAVDDASLSLPERLNKLVWDYVFRPRETDEQSMKSLGELDRMLVKPGDVRDIIVQAGGGSPDSLVTLNGGVATGKLINEYMQAEGVPSATSRIWLYGQSPRSENFQGHLQLDGAVFDGWDAPILEVWPEDAWIKVPHYRPGDHRGCACVSTPYIPNYGDPYQIEVE